MVNMTIAEARATIEQEAQRAFNEHCRPLIEKEMRRLKIRKIKYTMGVYFFTLNDGRQLSDTQFEESTEARKKFAEEYVYPFSSEPLFVDNDIEVT